GPNPPAGLASEGSSCVTFLPVHAAARGPPTQALGHSQRQEPRSGHVSRSTTERNVSILVVLEAALQTGHVTRSTTERKVSIRVVLEAALQLSSDLLQPEKRCES